MALLEVKTSYATYTLSLGSGFLRGERAGKIDWKNET